jgi:general secretion pathway protein K
MVLWILTLLMVIVVSFSFATRTETYGTLFFKEGLEKKYLAEAGIHRGVMELFHRGFYKNNTTTLEGDEVIKVDGTFYKGELGEDHYRYSILDESGKININMLTDASGIILSNLLVNQGVPKEQADTIVDSILDWMDGDDLHRLHGAESNYYMSLPNPYKAKNGKFDAVEELLMIKGVSPAIFYGDDNKPGISGFLTVASKVGGVNVNTASKEVLAALPGMTPESAEQVIALRGAGEIKNAEDLRQIAGEAFTLSAQYIGVSESNIYTIESTGYKKAERQGFTIKATVLIEAEGRYRCLYYKSPARMRS